MLLRILLHLLHAANFRIAKAHLQGLHTAETLSLSYILLRLLSLKLSCYLNVCLLTIPPWTSWLWASARGQQRAYSDIRAGQHTEFSHTQGS